MPTERDEEVLKHIGRYGVTLRVILEHRFFRGHEKACDAVINRLVKAGAIVSESGLPGGINYYHLSISEARKRGIPDCRARARRTDALRAAIQVLWYCNMTKRDRLRIEPRQIQDRFGRTISAYKPHCRETFGEARALYRIYTLGPGSRDDYLIKTVRRDWTKGFLNPELADWMRAGSYRFVILVESSYHRDKLRSALASMKDARPHIEVVPGLSSLHRAVRDFRQAHPPSSYGKE